jgi:Leucine-rich repeat (LRR) protein
MTCHMKTILPLIIFLITIGHAMSQDKNVFANLSDKDSVVICLRQYGLKEIPKDIGQLTNVITLTISPDPIKAGWTVYPPLSAFEEYIDKPPFRFLPNEIISLKKLRKLTLTQLAIKTLPTEFDRLENLEELDLSINKLTIKDEIDKLKNLKKLKHLTLFGNRVTKEDITLLKAANPTLSIDLEEYFKEKQN